MLKNLNIPKAVGFSGFVMYTHKLGLKATSGNSPCH